MTKNKLTITVAGSTGTGKSHVIKLIMDTLESRGFDVDIVPTFDYSSKNNFLEQIGKTAHTCALESISENTEVILINEQTIKKSI